MNKKLLLILSSLFVGTFCIASTIREDVCLSDGWILYPNQNESSMCYSATVPSTVLGVLTQDGFEPSEFSGCFDAPWIYEKEFSMPILKDGENCFLEFDGISYRANISLNGHLIADKSQVAGPFRMYRFNVTPFLRETNVLKVEVFRAQDGEFNIGFVDWNPRPSDESMGIFRPVWLRFSREVSILNPVVRTKVDTSSLKKAWLSVEATLSNNTSERVKGNFVINMDGRKYKLPVSIDANESKKIELDASKVSMLEVNNPRLWWCHNMGDPNMYHLDMDFVVGRRVSDTDSVDFGIRQIDSYFTEEGYRGFMLNGRKVLIKGAGWTDDIYLRNPDSRNEIELSYVKDMNLNTVRFENVWGTSQNVYDLCDRKGLLALVGWSCFWEWEVYSRTPNDNYGCIKTEADMELIAHSLEDQVNWLRNHPAIIAWYVGSDMLPRPELERKYLKVLDRVDTTRPYIGAAKALNSEISGPTGMKMVGPYDYQAPSYWYDSQAPGGAFGFNTETGIGAQMPMRESIEKMIPSDKLWPVGKEYDYHCTTAAEAMHSLDVLKDVMLERYGKAENLDDFLRKSHHIDYDGTRAMFESFRVKRPHSTGVIQWMLNSAWPSVYWQLYDWYLTPCASYYSVKKACAPRQLVYNYLDRNVYVVNDEGAYFKGKASIRVYSLDGNLVWKNVFDISTDVDSSVKLCEVPIVEGVSFLFLELYREDGSMEQTNSYALSSVEDVTDWAKYNWIRTPLKQSADYSSLQNMPKADVKYSVENDTSGGCVLTLDNNSEHVAFFLRLSVKDLDGELITPAFWEDNFFSMAPYERRRVRVELPDGVSKDDLSFSLVGWNL